MPANVSGPGLILETLGFICRYIEYVYIGKMGFCGTIMLVSLKCFIWGIRHDILWGGSSFLGMYTCL